MTTTDPVRTTPLVDSTGLLTDAVALRDRAENDGVLFFRGLLPPADVLTVRGQIADVVRAQGWLAPETTTAALEADLVSYEASMAAAGPYDGGSGDAYAQIQRLEKFHALAHTPALVAMYETLLGGRVLPHPRNISRIQVPSQVNVATPPTRTSSTFRVHPTRGRRGFHSATVPRNSAASPCSSARTRPASSTTTPLTRSVAWRRTCAAWTWHGCRATTGSGT